jgi:uncharacterized protein (TIGR02145 family)
VKLFKLFSVIYLIALYNLVNAQAPCSSPTIDGYTYEVVQMSDQCWFAENLRTSVYRNGDEINNDLIDEGATFVYGESSDACFNFNPSFDACDDVASLAEYGRLYNWYAVEDPRGLCPNGWHVPTKNEWGEMRNYISSQGFDNLEGAAMKSTYGWYDGGNGTDDFGFSALPSGSRLPGGSFNLSGIYGVWWSSSVALLYPGGEQATSVKLMFSNSSLSYVEEPSEIGNAVRCMINIDDVTLGCTDPNYFEYNPSANVDDGSCVTYISPQQPGCTDPAYLEYNPNAEVNDGSCTTFAVEGCTDLEACNYSSDANVDNESCEYPQEGYDCECNKLCYGDFNLDGIVGIQDLLIMLTVFGSSCP